MEVRELTEPPSLGRLYARGAAGIVRRRGGGDGALPERTLRLRDAEIDVDRLAEYTRTCGFRLGNELPATYPHVLAFPLAMELMVAPDFPYPLLGLVHIRNVIGQRRPLTVHDRPTIDVTIADARPHAKGRQFDVVAEARIDGEVVWTDRSTYLARGASGDGGDTGTASAETTRRSLEVPDDGPPDAVWEVTADTGRRYAAVSGDLNPIHLNAVTARAFGFPRQIAHGMWTKARCLAAYEGRLPPALEVDAAFKRPVVLPAEVALRTRRSDGDHVFSLTGARDGSPHLAGRISTG